MSASWRRAGRACRQRLSCAAWAPGRVLVADREAEPGGVPRHSWHTGYGLRDLRRVLTGPAYARALVRRRRRRAPTCGRDHGDRLDDRGRTARMRRDDQPGGRQTVQAAAVLLATGCRERPRAARLVPGDRPAGVMTTGELQQRVYLGGERLAGRAPGRRGRARELLGRADARARRAPAWSRWSPSTRGSRATRRSGSARRCGGGCRCGPRPPYRRIAGRGRLEGVEVADIRTGPARSCLRDRGLHRRLDSRPRTGPAGRARHRSRHPRAGGRHHAGHVG